MLMLSLFIRQSIPRTNYKLRNTPGYQAKQGSTSDPAIIDAPVACYASLVLDDVRYVAHRVVGALTNIFRVF